MGLSIQDILSLGLPEMKGHIRTKQKCPVCDGQFQQFPRLGFLCPDHKTIPNHFYIDLFHKGKRFKIFSDKLGQAISSYDRAFYLQERINDELDHHQFEPSHWIKGEAEKYYVSHLIEKFQARRLPQIAPSYQRGYKYILKRISDFFPITDIRDLRKLDILRYQENLEGRGMKGKTLKNNLDLFQTFLNWCKEMELISIVPNFPKVEVSPAPIRWITQEDQQKLYEVCPEEDKPIIAFLMLHGCRPGEARALRVKDINLSTQSITISSTWSNTEIRNKRKGKSSPAVIIPIHPEMMEYIKDKVQGSLPGTFLFTNPRSANHYTDSALDRVWKGMLKKVGIKGLKKYDALRHSFATNLVRANTPIKKIQWLLGHTSSKTTDRYIHADLETMKVEIEKLSLKKVIDSTVTKPEPRGVLTKKR